MEKDSLFLNLVKSKTGYNSKTFIMLMGVGLVFIIALSIIPLIYISILKGLTVPWYGLSTFFTSLATLAGVVIWGKVKTDSESYKYPLSDSATTSPTVD